MNLAGQDVLVIGFKRSGQAAIDLLLRVGARVRAMDERPPGPDERAYFEARGVTLAPQSLDNLGAPDLIVLSPAVPLDLPLLLEARGRGIPITGEVELASYFLQGSVIGITGANGKTTTTALTGHLLRACGIDCQVGGNIGEPVASMIATSAPGRWNVLELSSFQLETIHRFHAGIAACLNVTPDHLDRHHTFEAYANAKARLFETQRSGDSAVLNYDDATCRTFAARTEAEVSWFSSTQPVPSGAYLSGELLILGGQPFLERSQIPLRGLHNVENVLAASLIVRLAGAPADAIAAAVNSFPGVEHRLEFVRALDGVEYFNDSKATNVDATLKALEAFTGGLWVILGGQDKGSDYRPLRDPLAAKAKAVLLVGAAADKIASQIDAAAPLVRSSTLASAVSYARGHAAPGDVVLLAPACASFDQFENFEQRGRVFKQLVAELF